jgi:superfamily II DNA or RNA helicase
VSGQGTANARIRISYDSRRTRLHAKAWHFRREFLPYDADDPAPFREAIARARKKNDTALAVFFDLQPHPFQERILEKLALERTGRRCFKNLVIAATGTGKTVIAAFDYQRFSRDKRGQARQLWDQVGVSFYDYIVVDEAHHGTAASYRPLFDHFEPKILLGLTATPERMDGGNVAANFHHRFAAEIRAAGVFVHRGQVQRRRGCAGN